MRATIRLLRTGSASLLCTLPYATADHVEIDGRRCPECGQAAPWRVRGWGNRVADDDHAYEADALSVCCGARVGVLRVEVSTLFGVREDEAVLGGRCRVY